MEVWSFGSFWPGMVENAGLRFESHAFPFSHDCMWFSGHMLDVKYLSCTIWDGNHQRTGTICCIPLLRGMLQGFHHPSIYVARSVLWCDKHHCGRGPSKMEFWCPFISETAYAIDDFFMAFEDTVDISDKQMGLLLDFLWPFLNIPGSLGPSLQLRYPKEHKLVPPLGTSHHPPPCFLVETVALEPYQHQQLFDWTKHLHLPPAKKM